MNLKKNLKILLKMKKQFWTNFSFFLKKFFDLKLKIESLIFKIKWTNVLYIFTILIKSYFKINN